MKTTGSPTKRNSENAISPTASITIRAWPSRLRINASIDIGSCENVTNGLRREAYRVAEAARAAGVSLAAHSRALQRLALGGDAAAAPGQRSHSLLRALPARLPHHRGARGGLGRRVA